MLTLIDSLLNKITMYRLVLYFLELLLVIAAIFGYFGILPYDPIAIAFSALFLLVVAWSVNGIFAKLFRAQPNSESAYITALILALIITPVSPLGQINIPGILFLFWAAVWAMASKYIVAARKKHFFNPAAFAVALTALTINQSASWWVGGNLPLLIFVLVGGLLIVRKLRRFDLVLPFAITAIMAIAITSPLGDPLTTLWKVLIHTPIIFFATIMLTEPLTTPPTRLRRVLYGALVGALFAPALHLGPIYSTPELALLAGNIFSYLLSPKSKHVFTLAQKEEVGTGIYDFAFQTPDKISFRPGQYMEWTLSHEKNDSRGNRRYFTVASSPTEPQVHLGVRFYDPSSSFKKELLGLAPGAEIVAGQLAGDFTMPRNPKQKLVFMAGGIGITPFRSMAKYLTDRGEKRDVILLYSNRTPDEIAYKTIFNEAEKVGLKTLYVLTDTQPGLPMPVQPPEGSYFGKIDANLIVHAIPDYADRTFYISGSHGMVTAFQKTLDGLRVPRTHIKTDFFPGFV